MEFLHIKNIIIEIRTSMRGFKSGLSIVEEARHDRQEETPTNSEEEEDSE